MKIVGHDPRFASLAQRLECNCRPTEIGITYVVATNGHRQYRPCCMICAQVPVYNIPHDQLTEAEKAAAVFLHGAQPQQCKRCRTWGPVEIHHWAPHALFADHMAWPTAPLCRRCHDEWHRTLAAAAAKKGGAIFGRGFAPEAEEFPEIGVGAPTACPDVRGLCDDDAAEVMVEWFWKNFEDPAENTPWDEGEYVYIWGSPFFAREELKDAFGEVASDHALEAAIAAIENRGWGWAPSSQRRGPQP